MTHDYVLPHDHCCETRCCCRDLREAPETNCDICGQHRGHADWCVDAPWNSVEAIARIEP